MNASWNSISRAPARGRPSCCTSSWTTSWIRSSWRSKHSRMNWTRPRRPCWPTFEVSSRYSAPPAPGSVGAPQKSFPRAGDPGEDLPQGLPLHPGKGTFHYRDIYDHLAKFFELTETSRDIVTSLMEMYMSMLNNLMAKTANETNMTVRRLTFITTIFMPLTLLAGIGGMSEWSMMTGPANWKIAYPAFMLAMALIGIVSYHLLKRLEKKDEEPDRPAIGRR